MNEFIMWFVTISVVFALGFFIGWEMRGVIKRRNQKLSKFSSGDWRNRSRSL